MRANVIAFIKQSVRCLGRVCFNFCFRDVGSSMNRLKKKITVRVFSLKAYSSFFNDFVSIHNANQSSDKPARIINIREKKYLIKIHNKILLEERECYFLSVIRERNTWQARGLNDGTITGIPLNQGIIGDPYYYILIPDQKIIFGFTTGPSESLKSTAGAVLQQFSTDRTSKIVIEPVSKETEYEKLNDFKSFKELKVTVDTGKLCEEPNRQPVLLKGLNQNPLLKNSRLTLTIPDLDGYDRVETRGYIEELIESDCCSGLSTSGIDEDDQAMTVNLGTVYAVFNAELALRNNFIDEKRAKEVLLNALNYFTRSMKVV